MKHVRHSDRDRTSYCRDVMMHCKDADSVCKVQRIPLQDLTRHKSLLISRTLGH